VRHGAVALVVGMAMVTVVPATTAGARPAPPAAAPATSWELTSVATSGTSAFLVGYADAPSTAPVALHWNGSALTATPTPHPSGGAVLLSTATVPGTADAWAGGESCTHAACPDAFLLRWQGTSWAQVHLPHVSGSSAIISVSASSATDAWAVGQVCQADTFSCAVLLLHWNGTTWSKVTAPLAGDLDPFVYSVADLSPTDAWVVGGTLSGALALHWNGKSWTSVPVPDNSFSEAFNEVAAIPGTTDVWVLGAASGESILLKWNGHSFSAFPPPHPSAGPLADYQLTAVTASSATSAWTVGYSFSNSGTLRTVVLHLDEGTWVPVTSPSPAPANELFGVSASSASDAWAVGLEASLFQSASSGLALQWNGTAWTTLKVPVPEVPAAGTPRARRLLQPS
jgi:hypothetical protein